MSNLLFYAKPRIFLKPCSTVLSRGRRSSPRSRTGRRPLRLTPALSGHGQAPAAAARGVGEAVWQRAGLILVRDLREEARGHPVLALAPARAQLGVGEGERLPCARDAK